MTGQWAWQNKAACNGLNSNIFFPPPGPAAAAVTTAKQICATCEVQTDCLTWALANPDEMGVWGGTTQTERDRIRDQQIAPRRRVAAIRHGTPNAYRTHLRRDETPCAECKAANAFADLHQRRSRIA